jgi:glycosyltransferase involved in cell wall biosynthesis
MNSSQNISKISIVISVMNGSKTLERCLLSSFNQTYESKEIIVIDGLSTDGTINIVEKYSEKIDYWTSEPDTGIYNAWNKALQKVSGDWICFLGCDDWWYSSNSLAELVGYASYPAINFVSGKMYLVNEKEEVISSVGEIFNRHQLNRGMRIAHPSALHHRSLFEAHGDFNENYKIAGDYEFLLRSSDSIKPAFVPKNIVCMGDKGLSHMNWRLTAEEGYRALKDTRTFGYFAALRLYVMFYLAQLKKFTLGRAEE